MSRPTDHQRPPHIAFDFTVPSQGNNYFDPMSTDSQGHAHNPSFAPSNANGTPLRRKRSASSGEEDEDLDGDEGDEDEYMPEGGGTGRHYIDNPSTSYHHASSNSRDGGMNQILTSVQSGSQRKGSQPVGPDGQPPPKKKRRRQALSCTGMFLLVPLFFNSESLMVAYYHSLLFGFMDYVRTHANTTELTP